MKVEIGGGIYRGLARRELIFNAREYARDRGGPQRARRWEWAEEWAWSGDRGDDLELQDDFCSALKMIIGDGEVPDTAGKPAR